MECKKCLVTDKISGIRIDDSGNCDFCAGRKHYGVQPELPDPELDQIKQEYFRNLIQNLKQIRGKNKFDIIVSLSGGKDSVYLLNYMMENLKLKVLSINVDTGFESDLAHRNIKDIVGKLGNEHVKITGFEQIFKDTYKFYLTNFTEENTVMPLCHICVDLWQSLILRKAADLKVPYVLIGYSPEQTLHYFFKIPQERLINGFAPPDELPENLKRSLEKVLWPGKKEFDFIPEVIFPYHVFPDYSTHRIRNELKEKGLLPRSKTDPTRTNCHINWLMMYKDINSSGYNPYIFDFSQLIRKGIEPRRKWKILFSLSNFFVKNGIYPRPLMKKTLRKLGLTFSDLKR